MSALLTLRRLRGWALVALAAVALTLALTALMPDRSAALTKTGTGTLVLSQLKPLPGFNERGIVHLTVRPRQPDAIIAILIGLVVDPNNPNVTYALRLSSRTCRDIQRNPGSPGYVTRNLMTFGDGDGSAYLDDTDIVQVSKGDLRAARSVLLVALGDGSVRACGKGYKIQLEDILISS